MCTWYQSFVFTALEGRVIHATQYWSETNIADGLNALAICIEMIFFACFMWWAYTPAAYRIAGAPATSIWRPLWDSINYSDFALEIWGSLRFFIDYMRGAPETHSSETMKPNFAQAFGLSSGRSGYIKQGYDIRNRTKSVKRSLCHKLRLTDSDAFRSGTLEQKKNSDTVREVQVEWFLENALPDPIEGFDFGAVVQNCEKFGIITASGWKHFPTIPRMILVMKPRSIVIELGFDAVIETTNSLYPGHTQQFLLVMLSDCPASSERTSRTEPDATFFLPTSLETSTQMKEGPLQLVRYRESSGIQERPRKLYKNSKYGKSINFSFALFMPSEPLLQNLAQVVSSLQFIMTVDPSSLFVRLDYAKSRPSLVVRVPWSHLCYVDVFTNPGPLVHFFVSIAFSSRTALGWDPTIEVSSSSSPDSTKSRSMVKGSPQSKRLLRRQSHQPRYPDRLPEHEIRDNLLRDVLKERRSSDIVKSYAHKGPYTNIDPKECMIHNEFRLLLTDETTLEAIKSIELTPVVRESVVPNSAAAEKRKQPPSEAQTQEIKTSVLPPLPRKLGLIWTGSIFGSNFHGRALRMLQFSPLLDRVLAIAEGVITAVSDRCIFLKRLWARNNAYIRCRCRKRREPFIAFAVHALWRRGNVAGPPGAITVSLDTFIFVLNSWFPKGNGTVSGKTLRIQDGDERTHLVALEGKNGLVKKVAREVGTEGKLGVQAEVGNVQGIWQEITHVAAALSFTRLYSNWYTFQPIRQYYGRQLDDSSPWFRSNLCCGRVITVEASGEMDSLKTQINNMVFNLRDSIQKHTAA
ncbi:hypothetical protein D9757_013979 [Collybiopsis confluens]|uniref:Uncharacterized protein n=1 Tax=Collybiopsis confluens TaxID=2823264 RepID=A0A8H5LQ56_9AGAR|nr:hypothetical protein D9757_013979 [Collybiopsis confluens]